MLPEFNTPGHTLSWGLGNPDLLTPCFDVPALEYGPIDPTKNSTYEFIFKLYNEIRAVFRDQFVHLGGEEVDFSCWYSVFLGVLCVILVFSGGVTPQSVNLCAIIICPGITSLCRVITPKDWLSTFEISDSPRLSGRMCSPQAFLYPKTPLSMSGSRIREKLFQM